METLCFFTAVAFAVLLAAAMHGTLRLATLRLAMNGAPTDRLRSISQRLWWGVVMSAILATAAALALRPNLTERFASAPWACAFPVTALAGLLGVSLCSAPEVGILAWLSSCAYIVGALATAAFAAGVSPAWWIPGILLITGALTATNAAQARPADPAQRA